MKFFMRPLQGTGLQHFRRQRYNFHISFIPQFSRYGAENTCTSWLISIVQ